MPDTPTPTRISPEQLETMAISAPKEPQCYRVAGEMVWMDFPAALRQAARDARTLEALREWLDAQETNCDGMAESFWSYRTVLNKLDELESR